MNNKKKIQKADLKVNLLEWITSFFYLGKISKMPGTVGSLGALPMIYYLKTLSLFYYAFVFFLIFIIAFFSIRALERLQNQHDQQEIVIDEVLGMMVAAVGVSNQIIHLSVAFILFRVFDIFKPFPISWLDRNVKGSIGVILDDLLAGVFAFASFLIFRDLLKNIVSLL